MLPTKSLTPIQLTILNLNKNVSEYLNRVPIRSINRQEQRVSARHICNMCGGPSSTLRQGWCKEVLTCGSKVFFSGAPPCADHAPEVVTRGSKATRSFLFLTANSGAPGRGSPMPTPVARALGDFSPGSSSEESPFRFYH